MWVLWHEASKDTTLPILCAFLAIVFAISLPIISLCPRTHTNLKDLLKFEFNKKQMIGTRKWLVELDLIENREDKKSLQITKEPSCFLIQNWIALLIAYITLGWELRGTHPQM